MAAEPVLDWSRTLVVGNSGSGKSWLAERLALATRSVAVDLDAIHWLPGSYGQKRERSLAIHLTQEAAAKPRWIIEGVYGWLAEEALPRATTLIWLDLPVDACLANIQARGSRGGSAALEALLAWAADYPTRASSSAAAGHGALFAGFGGGKARLSSREAVGTVLAAIDSGPTMPAA